MPPSNKKIGKTTVPNNPKVSAAISAAKAKPLVIIGIVAALPVLILLAFTFKSGYAPNSKSKKLDKILVVKTPTEIAEDATAALQKNDMQAFADIMQNQVKDNVNIVNSKGDTLLMVAAAMGNLPAVEELLYAGADVNRKNAFTKDTAIMRALYANHPDIARTLVLSGADLNIKNNYNHSPLFLVLEKKNGELIDLFLTSGVKEGLDPNYLFRAAAKKNPMGIVAMLKGGVDPNVKNAKGNTPLIISASLGDVASVEALMAYRADVNAANNAGNTALMYAARYNHPDVIRELLKPQTMQAALDVDMQNEAGETALYLAAARGYVDVVRRLLAADADASLATKKGEIPLMAAEKNKRDKVLEWFAKDTVEIKNSVAEEDNAALEAQAKAEGRVLEKPKNPAKRVTDEDIFVAAANGDTQLAQRVLDQNKAVVFKKNKEGYTPLLVAVKNNQKEMITLLADANGRIFEATPNEGNMFHMAVAQQDKELLKHLAALARSQGRLAMMLEYKAFPQGRRAPTTPIGLAAVLCNKEIYDYLISIGAKPGIIRKGQDLGPLDQFLSPAEIMSQCKTKPAVAKTLKTKK